LSLPSSSGDAAFGDGVVPQVIQIVNCQEQLNWESDQERERQAASELDHNGDEQGNSKEENEAGPAEDSEAAVATQFLDVLFWTQSFVAAAADGREAKLKLLIAFRCRLVSESTQGEKQHKRPKDESQQDYHELREAATGTQAIHPFA
jgi:hypothetical protein